MLVLPLPPKNKGPCTYKYYGCADMYYLLQ